MRRSSSLLCVSAASPRRREASVRSEPVATSRHTAGTSVPGQFPCGKARTGHRVEGARAARSTGSRRLTRRHTRPALRNTGRPGTRSVRRPGARSPSDPTDTWEIASDRERTAIPGSRRLASNFAQHRCSHCGTCFASCIGRAPTPLAPQEPEPYANPRSIDCQVCATPTSNGRLGAAASRSVRTCDANLRWRGCEADPTVAAYMIFG